MSNIFGGRGEDDDPKNRSCKPDIQPIFPIYLENDYSQFSSSDWSREHLAGRRMVVFNILHDR